MLLNLDTTHRDRVTEAIAFRKPTRTPPDFAAVPEVWNRLGKHFGTESRSEILERLDVDCRVVSYDMFCRHPDVAEDGVNLDASHERSSTGGMWRGVLADGSNRDIWGAHRRRVVAGGAEFDEFASFTLGSAHTLDALRAHRWPEPAWWDFSTLRETIEELNRTAVYSIRYRVGSVLETAWSLYGFERFLADLASAPENPVYIMERIAEVHLENLRTVLRTAGDLIDIVYFYDDVASQESLLVSPKLYEKYLQPHHAALIEVAAEFGKPAMLHSCGSVYRLIPRWIDMGLAILNPVQPTARNMEPERLAAEFGRRIVFHGGVDVQPFLSNATAAQVQARVAEVSRILGSEGGYIRAGSHHIQADTPVANVLAMLEVE